ncbi:MAG: 5-oxopent-3-ene-1,2,5-tricarboxylate decarboxylase [Parasphingorhabdus sp.]|jgi:5-oxopent-3-ene-1,2,5-tricarboxylate decarboxylase/2-hydroxyhepta-2,4-diene-1,7-dioate isomerase
MRHARVTKKGSNNVIDVTVADTGALLTSYGETLAMDQINWLPPVANPGTVFALGLNYADHASELEFKAPTDPLVFLKGRNTLTGHLQPAARPDDIDFMHYECELGVVMGKAARYVSQENAMDYVAGYTVCNDFAIRDYLENYYRPNLRVKSRDSLCPIGPWLVDRDDVTDISNLKLTTTVNGKITQEGTTADMIFSVPFVIEYLSRIMTLSPGDIIATGTPKGVVDMQPGDSVCCEIESIGALITPIVSWQEFYGVDY